MDCQDVEISHVTCDVFGEDSSIEVYEGVLSR